MSDHVIVNIKQGALKGKTVEDVRGRKHFAFLGIPYGKPPVGNLRFKDPQPADGWSGVRDALEEGSPCKSRHSEKPTIIHGQEDCLYLNVYTPHLPKGTNEKPLAVMVWIHGGGFHMGCATANTYGPHFLLTENIVFVSMNYRLGIFGFLSFEDPSIDVPGNAGLKDQALALKWVRENISAFGGDPNNVTIFGESAGSASVHYLVLSPQTKGLFHRAILQSGVAINPWAVGQHLDNKIAEIIGIPGANEKRVYNELMKKSADELFDIQCKIPDAFGSFERRPWVPVIERPSPNALISEEPIKLLESGRYNRVPLLIGYTSREGLLSLLINFSTGKSTVVTDFEEIVPHFMKLENRSEDLKKVTEKVKKFYFGNEEPSEENLDKSILIHSDTSFIKGIQAAAKHHERTSPVYLYRFSIDGPLNFLKSRLFKMKEVGTCHADDLGYIFHSEWTPKIVPNSPEDIIQRSVVRLWTNFAKHGDPNVGEKDNLIKVHWKPIDSDTLNFLDIGENLTVGVDPDQSRMDFWDRVYNDYSQAKGY